MSAGRPEGDDEGSLPLSMADRVDRACDRFEAAWNGGGRPLIEDELAAAPEADRAALFRSLMETELEIRRRRGERPRERDYFGRFPDRAAEIGLHFSRGVDDTVEAVRSDPASEPAQGDTVSYVAHGSTEPADAGRDPPEVLGAPTGDGRRFRVLKPHARGGLGAVFLALDAELNREVALKQILEGHADDPTSRARFLLEAEITGGLEHPGIVPVYGLGRYEDGRPFYAMRFIRGDSLKEAIAAFHADAALKADPGARSLALRKLLRRYVAVCDAVDYAHGRGVIHRDLKPANIIVGRHGETLVVDWGLAKATGRAEPGAASEERTLVPSSASGSAETLPGSALGTPAYMSPEQAAGDLDRIGPRSDVYSLGATLYCLLTGGPPFAGGGVADVLAAVRAGRFPSPRQVDRSIDPPLEAICLKAMALRPEDRYGSAHALAEDVERWMADEPIAAHREPWTKRAGRWARRHRPLVAGVAALIATGVVALAVSTVLIGREKALAEANFRDARAAVDDYLTTVGESRLLDVPRLEPLRKELLGTALKYYRKFIERRGDDPSVRAELAEAYERMGRIEELIGSKVEAVELHRRSLELRRTLARDEPGSLAHRRGTGVSHLLIGTLLDEAGRAEDAKRCYREGIAILEPLIPETPAPGVRHNLGVAHNNLASHLLKTGQTVEAEEQYRRSIQLLEPTLRDYPGALAIRVDLGRSYRNLARLLHQVGRTGEAESMFRRAAQTLEPSGGTPAVGTIHLTEISKTYHGLALLWGDIRRRRDAIPPYRRAIDLKDRLAREHPDVGEYRRELAKTINDFGLLLADLGDTDEAARSFRHAIEILKRLADEHPTTPALRLELARSHFNLGNVQSDISSRGDAERSYLLAIKLLVPLARDHLEYADFPAALAIVRNNYGNVLTVLRRPHEAARQFREAIDLQRRLVRDDPGSALRRLDLARTLRNFGQLHRAIGSPAEEAAAEAVELLGSLAREDPADLRFRRLLAGARLGLGVIRKDANLVEDARRELRGAESLLQALPDAGHWDHYGVACARSLQSALAAQAQDRARAEALASGAVEALGRALDAGLRDVQHIRADTDLDPIRRRDDFGLLMRDLAFPRDPFARPPH